MSKIIKNVNEIFPAVVMKTANCFTARRDAKDQGMYCEDLVILTIQQLELSKGKPVDCTITAEKVNNALNTSIKLDEAHVCLSLNVELK